MKKDFPVYNRIYPEYFAGPDKPNPTRTTVEVGALPTPIAIELKVIAVVEK
jgi:2-aminomuconate deaminase